MQFHRGVTEQSEERAESERMNSEGRGLRGAVANNDLAELSHLLLLVGVGKPVEDLIAGLWLHVSEVLEALTSDASGQVKVLLHDSDSGRVDGAEVRIFKDSSEVALSRFLESEKSLGLEAELTINAVTDGANKPLEGSFRQEEVRRLLVSLDLAQCNCTRPPSHLPLHAAFSWRGLLGDGCLGVLRLAGLGARCHALLSCRSFGWLNLLLSCYLYSWHVLVMFGTCEKMESLKLLIITITSPAFIVWTLDLSINDWLYLPTFDFHF